MTISSRRVRPEFFSLSTTRVVNHSRFFADHNCRRVPFNRSDKRGFSLRFQFEELHSILAQDAFG